MIQSITGYARNTTAIAGCDFVWEIKSINHRYLEMAFRLPESVRQIEPELRKVTKQLLQRGKVDINLKIESSNDSIPKLAINTALAQALINAQQQLSAYLPEETAAINIMDLLRWPGIINQDNLLDHLYGIDPTTKN